MPEHRDGWDRDDWDRDSRDPRDPLGSWLAGQVTPLPPPPGTLERIRKRARRRKLSRAAGAAAGAAAVVAALAIVPRLALPALRPAGQPNGVAAGHPISPAPASRASSPLRPASTSTPSPVSTVPPVPPHFAPSSVTFVGTSTGWVIGQAGVPGHCADANPYICTSLARTDDGGRSWYGVPAPKTGAPGGPHGVSQLRFQNTLDGWAFGPELWATHDGGQSWTRIGTHGQRVTDLETVNGTVYAVWARCGGSGAGYASDCTSFSLYSSPAGSDNWQPAGGAASGLTAGGAPSSALLLLTGTTGYLLPPSGGLLTAPMTGPGQWRPASSGVLTSAPCTPGVPGRANGALLAVTGTSRLVLLCQRTGQVYSAPASGSNWRPAGQAAAAGTPASLSGSLSGWLILATSQGISYSRDGGGSWQQAAVASPPPGGFSYVGMTTASQGVALPASPRQGAVWFTYDGGRTWRPSPVR